MSEYLNPIQSSTEALARNSEKVSPTAVVAQFVADTQWQYVPTEVAELGKKHILDGLGLVVAGQNSETAPLVRAYQEGLGLSSGSSTVLGTTQRLPARFAAFANAVAIHAHDYDDTQLAVAKDRAYGLLTHPTVTALPPALALAEKTGATGKDFMLAYHLGMEVECKLAEASGPRSYRSGFHSTGVFGVFGATAASAKILGLSPQQIRHAFGIAGAHASGLIENIGSMTKPFQAGHSAEGGVVAAELASIGWTAAENILEGRRGFYTAHAGEFDEEVLLSSLGDPWTLVSPGISIKPFPSGSQMHAAMDSMLFLVLEHNLKPEDVAQVRVGAKQALTNTLTHYQPQDGVAAKFSVQFAMATILVDRRAGLMEYEDEAVLRPEIQNLMPNVELYHSLEADAAGDDKLRSYVEVTLKNGQVLHGEPLDFARGSLRFPMSFDDVTGKFMECVEFAGFPKEKADQIVESVLSMESARDMSALSEIFVK